MRRHQMMITAFRTVRSWSQSAIRETASRRRISLIFSRGISAADVGYRRVLPAKETPVWGFIFPARSSHSIPGVCLQRIIQAVERRYPFPCRITGKTKVCSGASFRHAQADFFLICYSLHLRASSIGTLRIFLLSARLMMAYITIPMRNISGNSDGFT